MLSSIEEKIEIRFFCNMPSYLVQESQNTCITNRVTTTINLLVHICHIHVSYKLIDLKDRC